MGWFDRQIRKRKQSDQDIFESAIYRMASVVMGRQGADADADARVIAKAEIDKILKYYRFKPAEIPASVKDSYEQLEYCLRPHGIMRRLVKLEEGWQKDAIGPMLAYLKEGGTAVALLPGAFDGYWFTDPSSGKRVKVTRSTAKLFDEEAYCFYRPLPQKELSVPDLFLFLKSCVSGMDWLVVVLLMAMATFMGMLLPTITKFLTSYVLNSGKLSLLAGTAAFMALSLVSSQLLQALKDIGLSRIKIKAGLSLEAAMMMRIINLPPTFFRDYSAGELSNRALYVNQLSGLLIDNVVSIGLSSLMSLMYLVQCFRFAPALAGPALLIILASFAVSLGATVVQTQVSQRAMQSNAKTSGIAYAIINGVQKIKLSGAEKRAFARWGSAYSDTVNKTYNIPTFLKISGALTTAVTLAGTIALYTLAVNSGVSAANYIAFNASYGAAAGAFALLSSVALTVAQIRPILDITRPILQAVPETTDNKTMVTSLSGSIELANIHFRYNEDMPYVVNGMSLKIHPGEYIAIVGPSGCGKSTLLRLLLGFEKPERGAIYYDGKDIKKLDVKSLRRKIGSVTQDGSLFPADIFSNIIISAPQLTLDDAWAAAELAGIADDIRAMPMQMHTVIAEGQGGVSGGQKQRIMIARAVAPKPKILMFDEATSALDNKTQKQVSDALDAMKCTRIVIAHRLSTIKNCDRILMLEGGKVVEDGTYDELIALNGRFAQLVERQRLDVD